MSTAAGSVALAVNGLSRSFGGVVAVDDVSFQVPEGEIFGVIGPNGAGKTTLFNLVSGIVPSQQGRIEFFGRRIEKLQAHRRASLGLGRTFQTSQLFGELSVRQNYQVAVVGGRRGLASWFEPPSARDGDRVDGLKAWGLLALADRPAGELSLFDQQRLAIAMALADGARALLLDEPSGGLVEREVLQLLDLIREIRGQGITVLVVDHKMRLMMQLCDRIMVMALGAEVMTGSPDEVAADARVHELYFGRAGVAGHARSEVGAVLEQRSGM